MDQENGGVILVVDDNEMNRDMLSRRLQRQNHIVDVAEDGERALEMMRSGKYDLVLLDIMMPKVSGYEVLDRAKADENLRDIPIIMISALDDLDSVVQCIEKGAEDYLFKPFNPVLLKARVSASLDKKFSRNNNHNPAARSTLDAISRDLQQLASGGLNAEQAALVQQLSDHVRELDRLLDG